MTNFHPHTIDMLQNELDSWRERLEDAESDLKFREGQTAKAREVAEAARQRVADYERLLAVAEPEQTEPVDAFDAYTDAQLLGEACISCGREFGSDEPGDPTVLGPRGQMFAHVNPDDCKAVKP